MKPQTSATLPTPGPWEARPEKLESGFHAAGRGPQVVCGNKVIADIRSGHTKLQRDEAETNARLFAAAPELLEALEQVTRMIEKWRTEGKPDFRAFLALVDKCEGAIRKARGTE